MHICNKIWRICNARYSRQTSDGPWRTSVARDFIVKPDGSKEFGHFGKEIEDATGGKVLAKGIRLQVGFSRVANGKETGFGIIHIKKRESQLKKLGYNNAEEYILDIINHFSIIYDLGGGRIKLASVGSKFNVMPLDLELKGDRNGYYTVVTAIPQNTKRMQKEAGKKILIGAHPHPPLPAMERFKMVVIEKTPDLFHRAQPKNLTCLLLPII